MSNLKKALERVMSGHSDANVAFEDAFALLARAGYTVRHGRGSHRIFTKPGCVMLNLQDRNGKVTPYQVKQLRESLKNQTIQ